MTAKQDSKPQFISFEELSGAPSAVAESALAHGAALSARCVIARVQDTSRKHCLNLSLPHNQSPRARWYARAQQGLQDWIDGGGFSLPVDAHDAAALAGTDATRCTLYRLSYDEPKVSRSCVG